MRILIKIVENQLNKIEIITCCKQERGENNKIDAKIYSAQ